MTGLQLEARQLVLSVILSALVAEDREKAHRVAMRSAESLPHFIRGLGQRTDAGELMKLMNEEMRDFWKKADL